jgi:hypothetical protein
VTDLAEAHRLRTSAAIPQRVHASLGRSWPGHASAHPLLAIEAGGLSRPQRRDAIEPGHELIAIGEQEVESDEHRRHAQDQGTRDTFRNRLAGDSAKNVRPLPRDDALCADGPVDQSRVAWPNIGLPVAPLRMHGDRSWWHVTSHEPRREGPRDPRIGSQRSLALISQGRKW